MGKTSPPLPPSRSFLLFFRDCKVKIWAVTSNWNRGYNYHINTSSTGTAARIFFSSSKFLSHALVEFTVGEYSSSQITRLPNPQLAITDNDAKYMCRVIECFRVGWTCGLGSLVSESGDMAHRALLWAPLSSVFPCLNSYPSMPYLTFFSRLSPRIVCVLWQLSSYMYWRDLAFSFRIKTRRLEVLECAWYYWLWWAATVQTAL